MKTKKLLALIMALAMLLSSLPMAFADAVTEPEEPISEWGEVDLSDAAGEPVVEEEEDADLVQELPDDGEPIEEPEDPELVNDNVNYVVKVIFNYSGAPGQDDVELTLQNGVLKAEQEALRTPKEWEGHKFLGWQSADFAEEEVVALEEGDDPRKGLKEGTLSGHTFSNSTTVYVKAVWETEYFEVLFKDGTPAAHAIMPMDLKDYTGDQEPGPDLRVEYGTILDERKVAVFPPERPVDGYDYENPIYKVGGEVIDIATYEIKEKTVITVEIPLQTVIVSFYLDADDEAAWLEQQVEYGSFAERPEEDPTDEHRTFLDWYEEGAANPFDFADPILGDTDLYADWEAEMITVTFDPAGGKINGSTESVELPIEYKTAIGSQGPEPVMEGMYFVGWLLDGEGFDTDTEITEAITLTANYTAEPVYLTYVRTVFTGDVPYNNEVWPLNDKTPAEDDEIDEYKQVGAWGGAVTPFEDVTREGYTLAGWWDGETVDKDGKPVPFDFSAVKEDADELTAIWEPNPITITLVAGHDGVTFAKDGADGKPLAFTATITSHYGATLTLNDVQEGDDAVQLLDLNDIHDFDFLGWYTPDEDQYGDPIKVEFVGPKVLTEDITLYADWNEYYTVTMYDGVDDDKKPIPFAFVENELNWFNDKGEIRFYVADYEDAITFGELGVGIYAKLDAEPMLEGKQYFDGFVDADGNEFDLVEDEIEGDLTLTANRLDLVEVTFVYNGDDDSPVFDQFEEVGPRDQWVVLYPTGKTLADAEDLRGAERFPIPELTRPHHTFLGYKKGTADWGDEDPFTAATELIAQWKATTWTVTLELDGGEYAYDTEYEVLDGTSVELRGAPTKTDCIFGKNIPGEDGGQHVEWVTYELNDDLEEVMVPFIPGVTQIFEDTTVYATWTTFAAKDKTATGDPAAEENEGKYFTTLEAAFGSDAKDIVILQDFTGTEEESEYPAIEDDLEIGAATKSVDMGGHTLELAAGAHIMGNGKATFKNGKIIGTAALNEENSTWLVDINIASGSYENVRLDLGEQAISGGKFRWTEPEGFEGIADFETWDEFVEDGVVWNINEANWVVEGKKLHLKNGWYTPTEYKTLTIYPDKASVELDDDKIEVTVFKGEKTEIPEEVEYAIEHSDDKFQKWLIYDAEAEEGAEPEEFTFGATLTEDTVIYGDWIKAVTVTFWVYGYKLWEQETYSDQLIEEPVEPTEDDYAEMTNSQEADVRGAWEIIHSEGFLGWRYDDGHDEQVPDEGYENEQDHDFEMSQDEGHWHWERKHYSELDGVNVKFGVDKARDINIYAATKNQITFYGLGNEVVDVLWLDDGETVNDHGGMPEAPEVEGYTFNYWLDEGNWDNAEIFKPNKKIYEDHDVYATYATGNWAISVVDTGLSDGCSSLPTDALVFGGDEELSLYPVPQPTGGADPLYQNLTPGKYYLAFEIEAPDGVGDLNDNVNQTEWTYKTDDEEWQSFNGEGEHRFDYTNGSQHLVLQMYKEVTWDMLKDLIDAEDHVKTWTITLAPKDQQDDESAYVVLTVTLDPKNVYLYNAEDFDPVRGIINYNYKFTVSFEMDGGAAIKPIVYEYGDNFLDRREEIEFEDEELNEAIQADEGNFNVLRMIKKYFVWYGFGYYENEGEEELSQIEMADGMLYGDGFIVRRDQSVYALYLPMPLRLAFFDKYGEQIGEYYTDRRQFNNYNEWMEGAYGIGSPLNHAEVPEGLAAQYGTTTWYPVKLDPDSIGQNPPYIDDDDDVDLELLRDEDGNFQMADAPYDFTSSEIVGDLYYDERQHDPVDPKDEGYIINSDDFMMYGPFLTVSYMGVIIDEQDGMEVAFLDWDSDYADPLSDTFYTFNESGDLTFGEIEVPTFDEEELAERGIVFNGWLLLDEDHMDDETWGDLKPFNFEKNASKSVKGKELASWDFEDEEHENVVVFAPSFTYLNGGTATLYSANVFFEGAIKMIFKYNFRYWDRSAEHYVVFRQGEEELARVSLKDLVPDETGVDYNDERGDRYLIYCPVPIVNYTDPINVRVETADGEEWRTTTGKGADVEGGYDYSLQKYAENKASSTNEKMAALAKALQDYGIAARQFVGKDVGDLALSAAVTGLEVSDMEVEETVVTAKDDRPAGITASQNVVFSFDNTLQVTFKGCDANCTFTLDGDPWEGELVDGNAVMEVPNIAPNELDTPHTFTCTKGGKTFEVKTSVLGYAKRTADKGSTEMKNLAKALYVYAKAAIAYVG